MVPEKAHFALFDPLLLNKALLRWTDSNLDLLKIGST